MEWINIHTSTMTSESVLDATPVQLATWLRMLHYCCAQENSGRLAGAKSWDERKWLRTANVTLADVADGGRLWRWRGEDLLLEFYPLDKQNIVQKKRKFGGLGGKASGERRAQDAAACAARDGSRDASPDGGVGACPDGEAYASRDGSTEGKGREEKGMEEEGNARAQEAKEDPHVPSEREFMEAFVVDGIPPEYLQPRFTWFQGSRKRWFDRHGDLLDWRWLVRRWWMQDRATWTPNLTGHPAGGANSAGTGDQKNGALTVRHQVVLVDKELAEIDAAMQSQHELGLPVKPEDRARKALLKKRRVELLGEGKTDGAKP